MQRQPGVDNGWFSILAHRPADQRDAVVERFVQSGVGVEQVRAALESLGDDLCRAAQRVDPGWATPFGGELAVALLAAEVSALAAYLNSRASAVRGRAVDGLLEEFSAVTVASRLGVSRQKVYEVARMDPDLICIERPGGHRHG